MKIAFASGKGGTGKTMVSVNLSKLLSGRFSVQYIDCDVEEPNGHLFLKPSIKHSVNAAVYRPKIDEVKCTNCGVCSSFCAFKAITSLPNATFVFPELCHSCGGCKILCPEKAITEVEKIIGIIQRGEASGIDFIQGRLKVGAAMSSPLIRMLMKYIDDTALVFMDSPPGSACAAASAVYNADLIAVVAEPTPFGVNDMKIIIEMIKAIKKPFGVIINRYNLGGDSLKEWCLQENISVFGRIDEDMEIARAGSKGLLIIDEIPYTRKMFETIAKNLLKGAYS